jgi:hypothetical protein
MIANIRSVQPVEGQQPGGASAGQAAKVLVPGDLIEATVVQSQETGNLVILVKGIPIEATSQVGRLQVGQTLHARVEQGDGQILLRVGAQAELPATTLTVTGEAGTAERTAQLLRVLLPAGNSLVSSLQKLVQTVRASAESGALTDQAVTGLATLLDKLQVKPGPVTADSLRQALQALGLEYERQLSEQVAQGQSLGSASIPFSLKGWLMSAVADQGRATVTRHLSIDRLLQGLVASVAEGAGPEQIESQLQLLRERLNLGADPATAQRVVQTLLRLASSLTHQDQSEQARLYGAGARAPLADSQGQAGLPALANPAGPTLWWALAGQVKDLSSLVQESEGRQSLEAVSIDRLVRSIKELMAQGAESGEIEHQLTLLQEKISSSTQPDVLTKGKQDVQGLFVTLDRYGSQQGDPLFAATAKGRLAAILSEFEMQGLMKESGAGTMTGWAREAHEVLRLIERTQVVNSMNAQSGQPMVFELPTAWQGTSSVRFYIERRDDGGETGGRQGPRPYRVVTMLDVDRLGAVRVDALFTGKQVSARVFVDRPEVERTVTKMLPLLQEALSARGFTVEALSASVAETPSVRGEELDVKSVPKRRLLNLTA